MQSPEHHVLIRSGDATGEVEEVLREIGASAEEAGLERSIFVTRANQTVVLARASEASIAQALRARPGWSEPGTAG